MPELPEVETVRRLLEKKIIGKSIKDIKINFPKIIANLSFQKFIGRVRERKILFLSRRGKFLIFHLSGGKILISHLRMTGQWLVVKPAADSKFIHLVFYLSNGHKLVYSDIRKFGRIWLIDKKELPKFKPLLKLGPEPMSAEFSLADFRKRLRKYKTRIKTVLLNQELVAGLGNIYADEVLFLAGVRPTRKANNLTRTEISKIYEAIKDIIPLAIRHKGTTVVNYTTPDGGSGGFQEKLKVYGRKGQECPRCGREIRRIVLGGRGTHYCPKCQR